MAHHLHQNLEAVLAQGQIHRHARPAGPLLRRKALLPQWRLSDRRQGGRRLD